MVTLMTRMTAGDLHSLGNNSHESREDGLPALGPLGESTAQNLVQLLSGQLPAFGLCNPAVRERFLAGRTSA
jgi:hypothetical protein